MQSKPLLFLFLAVMAALMNPPVDETKVEIIEGETPEAIAEVLVEKILAEKVL